jgi:hypothetical protein
MNTYLVVGIGVRYENRRESKVQVICKSFFIRSETQEKAERSCRERIETLWPERYGWAVHIHTESMYFATILGLLSWDTGKSVEALTDMGLKPDVPLELPGSDKQPLPIGT